MKRLVRSITLAIAGLLVLSCERTNIQPSKEQIDSGAVSSGRIATTTTSCCNEVINFDTPALPIGTVSQVYAASGLGPIGIYGSNPKYPGQNAAMIFNSSNPTGGDTDLKTPGYNNTADLKNVLIVSEDLDASDPDDTDLPGATLTFDFSALGTVNICSLTIIDLQADEGESGTVEFYSVIGKIGEVALPTPGDNAVAVTNFNQVNGVVKMVVTLNGSSAIDDIRFCVNPRGCTRTQGYWKTHSKYGPAAKVDEAWSIIGEDTPFYLSGMTYYEVINTSSAGGNAYFILARQFIAAKLNIYSGASAPAEVISAITAATTLFETYTPDQIAALSGDDPVRQQFISLAGTLGQYNEGKIGPGHCSD